MKKLLFLLILFSALYASAQKARRLEILFLGDNGHHRPIERVPAIMAALGDKGVNFTYTDKLEDINLANLNKYDALMIYANWDSIPPSVEKDLLAYVASGKGILPIHCASYCFRNSSEYVKMVGGQFWRHTKDTIETQTVQPEHAIMAGLKSFRAYDETYLHTKLQADNNILAVREIKADQFKDKPNTKTEPYTWTRSYGKGRVFYTAYGHDENTWQNEENREKLVKDWMAANPNYTFNVLLDTKNIKDPSKFDVIDSYNITNDGIPQKYIIDPNGNIRFKKVGFSGTADGTVKELDMMIALAKGS